LIALASLYVYTTEEYDKAVPIIQKIITEWLNPEYHDLLGYALCKSGKIYDAGEILENTPPEFLQPETVILLSQHYQEIGKWREAAEFVEKYAQEHPENRRILDHLAYLYKRLGWNDHLKKLMLSWEESNSSSRTTRIKNKQE
jgi:tetratricopeptide (TPR) repeat protein